MIRLKTVLLPALLISFLTTEATTARAAVSISSPASRSKVSSPAYISATASGSPTSITVYDNQKKILQKYGVTSIRAYLELSAGTHTIKVTASYTSRRGRVTTSSASRTFTVNTVSPTPTPTATPTATPTGAPTSTPTPNPTATPTPGPVGNVAAQIANDMVGLNEGNPHGVPLDWDFATHPVIVQGNTPPSGWNASIAWGVIYAAAEGNPATNTRVNIRNQQLLFLSKATGQWSRLQSTSSPEGASYPEDFVGNEVAPDVRTEPDGTISVRAGKLGAGNYTFHFHPNFRASINPTDIAGVVSCFEARLIVGNPSVADDRSTARYLAEGGADYWPSVNGQLPASYNGIVPPVGNGKFKYVQNNWRSFCMTTNSLSQLTANPPPVSFTGVLP